MHGETIKITVHSNLVYVYHYTDRNSVSLYLACKMFVINL